MAIKAGLVASLVVALAVAACSVVPGSRDRQPSRADPASLSAVDAARSVRDGHLTATALVSAVLARAKEQHALNAYITLDEAGALQQARDIDARVAAGDHRGRLLGVPLAIKDNIEIAGLPNTAGTAALAEFVPQYTAPVAQSLINEGAVILGKTNMHELAFGITSNNARFGAVGNPYRPDYFPGGSSGGTAAAVAARMATAGLGTDTGGSVRIPAALTGIYGLRPSAHRYVQHGITPISRTRDTVGPMARSVVDLILMDAVMAGGEADFTPADVSTIRLGVPRSFYYEDLDAGILDAVNGALRQLEDAGVELVEVDVVGLPEDLAQAGFALVAYEFRHALPLYLAMRTHAELTLPALVAAVASPDVRRLLERLLRNDQGASAQAYHRVKQIELPRLRQRYQDVFDANGVDALIFPTVPVTARSIRGSDDTIVVNGVAVPTFATLTRNTGPASVAGTPGISLPVGLSEAGLPIGMEIDGPYQSDQRLLSIALTLEAIFGAPDPPQ